MFFPLDIDAVTSSPNLEIVFLLIVNVNLYSSLHQGPQKLVNPGVSTNCFTQDHEAHKDNFNWKLHFAQLRVHHGLWVPEFLHAWKQRTKHL